MSVIVVLLGLGGAVLLYGLFLRLCFRRVTVTRSFSRKALFEGETGEMVEVVTNPTPLMIPWLRLESSLPEQLHFGGMENLRVSGGRHHLSFFTLLPYKRITRRHRVTFAGRGIFEAGNAAVTAGDLLGLNQAERQISEPVRVIVWPRLLQESELPQPLIRIFGELPMRRAAPDPFLISGIRPYRAGDPVRDIHWPASDRMGSPQVRVHDRTGAMRLLTVLCGDQSPDQWGSLSESEMPSAEHGIRIAATLCLRALRGGMAAGFAVNFDRGDGESLVLMPEGGPAWEEKILTAMAKLRLKRTVRCQTFLKTLHGADGMDILLLMPPGFPPPEEEMARLRAEGSQVEICPAEVR